MRRIVIVFLSIAVFLCGCSDFNTSVNLVEKNNTEREKLIEEKIETIDGVHSAIAVIRGSAVLIGVVIERGYEKENNEIKSMAAAAARLTDKAIKSTAVTCNGEITLMIKNLKNVKG